MPAKTKRGIVGETVLDTLNDPATGDTLYVASHPGISASAVGAAEAAEGEPARGDSIGRFVLLGVLGAGGMGLVYSAYDPHLDRKVAIKLLRAGMLRANGDDATTRLLREAQAMAKINHPNVIKVHEVGTLDEQIYLAMEFADGGTLRAWLKDAARTHREIIAVFVQAGRGLAAAHAVGLAHRDFKPDNVLMATDGNVRVTDFGLVSVVVPSADDKHPTLNDHPPVPAADVETALSGRNTPLSVDLTRTGSVMGTPSYMAPEQFGGAAATERTDQFAFCIALYEALYGERPFPGTSFAELSTRVLLGQVSPPPAGTRVPGWLRRVLLRGLAVEQADRYPTMTALLAELARDPGRHRRRLFVAGGAGVCIAAAALLLALRPDPTEACRGGRARVAKIWNAERRGQIERAFAATHRPHAATTAVKLSQILDDWARTWELGYVDACEDTRVRAEQSEHMLDLRMLCLTRRLDEAGTTIEVLASGGGEAADRALEATLALPSIAPCADAAALTAAVAPPETELARLQVEGVRRRLDEARAQDRLGRYGSGLEVARAALLSARTTGYRPVIAEAQLVSGWLEVELADTAGVTTLREAMHAAAESGDDALAVHAAAKLVYVLTTQRSRYDAAEEVAGLAEASARRARPPPETMVRLHNSIGLLQEARGKNAAARTRYENALVFAEKELGRDHPSVMTTLNQLGNLAKKEGRFADARALLERMLATRERLVGKDHPDIAIALNNLGNVYRVEGKLDDAKRLYDRALAIRLAALGPDHPEVGTSYNNLGMFFSDQGDEVTAQGHFEKALALWEKKYGPDSVEIAAAVINLGSALNGQGKRDEARKHFERAQVLFESAHGPDHPTVGNVVSNLGVVALESQKFDEALALYRRAHQIYEQAYGSEHPDVADALLNIATALRRLNKLDEAQATNERALRIAKKAYGADHIRIGMILSNLGGLQLYRDDWAGAYEYQEQALAIFEAKLGKNHPNVSYPLLGMGASLARLGRAKEAIILLERALAIREASGMPANMVLEVREELTGARKRR